MEKPKKTPQRKVMRDAKTGRWTSSKRMQQHPEITVEETIVVPKPKRGKK